MSGNRRDGGRLFQSLGPATSIAASIACDILLRIRAITIAITARQHLSASNIISIIELFHRRQTAAGKKRRVLSSVAVGHVTTSACMLQVYRVAQKLAHFDLCHLNSSNIEPGWNSSHCKNPENICNNTVTKVPFFCKSHFKSVMSCSKADTLNIWCKNCRMRQLL